ncbi:MAG TPA: type II toxin-antitoxin system RelE/ParE family toxin [Humibacter sp.]|jgi:hypothetical protein|nr:type II toxin-antitoxin system RelE/ParE family toxin [Humibacter sp.]
MSWHVEFELIADWLEAQDPKVQRRVIAAATVLAQDGPQLGRPLVDSVEGSRHNNMKELRTSSNTVVAIRILFAFDPRRQAILLLAGNKGGNWKRWYRENISVADDLFDEHLIGLKNGSAR